MPTKSLEYFISSAHWLDAMTPPLEEHLKRLASTIQILLERTLETPKPRLATPEGLPHAPKELSAEDHAGSGLVAPQVDDVAATSPHPQLAELLVRIPAGEFLMGSSDSDTGAAANEKPQHSVRITNSFFLGKSPVTELLFWQYIFSEFKFERPGVKQRTDPTGPHRDTTPARQYVFRGGCCFDPAENLRSAKRNWVTPTPARGTFIGFRVARTLEAR